MSHLIKRIPTNAHSDYINSVLIILCGSIAYRERIVPFSRLESAEQPLLGQFSVSGNIHNGPRVEGAPFIEFMVQMLPQPLEVAAASAPEGMVW